MSDRISVASQLVRGLEVLERVAIHPQTAAEVARILDVNRSTSLRILRDLENAGYLQRDPLTKRYWVRSERLYALVTQLKDHWDIMEVFTPILSRLRDGTREATVLAVPAPGVMVYMACFPAPQPVAVWERIGAVRPVHASAVGKAWLSALSPTALDIELGRASYEGGTERSAKGPIELRARVDHARQQGFAVDMDETFMGVSCVAVPALVGENIMGAVGISLPSSRLDDNIKASLGSRLIQEVSVLRAEVHGSIVPPAMQSNEQADSSTAESV